MNWKNFFRKDTSKFLIALIASLAVFVGLAFQIFIVKSILSSIESELKMNQTIMKNRSLLNKMRQFAKPTTNRKSKSLLSNSVLLNLIQRKTKFSCRIRKSPKLQ